jgi:HEAT repeat protein
MQADNSNLHISKLKLWLFLGIVFGLGIFVGLIIAHLTNKQTSVPVAISSPKDSKTVSVDKTAPPTTSVDKTATPITPVDETATPTKIVSTTLPKFRWESGARQVYHYDLQTEMETNTNLLGDASATNWQKVIVELKGTLNVRLFEKQAKTIVVGFQLSPAHFSLSGQRMQALEKSLYQTFFMAIFTLEGVPVHFYFPNTIHASEQKLLAEIVNSVQIITPTLQTATQWTSKEENATGQYEAQYKWQAGKIHKQKRDYLTVNSSTTETEGVNEISITGQIINSDYQAILATKRSWLQELSGSEKLEISSQHGKIAKSALRISLRASDEPIDPTLAIWQANNDPEQVMLAFASGKSPSSGSWEQLRQQNLREKFAHVTVGDLTQQIIAFNAEDKSMGDMIPYLQELEDYLSVYPEAAAEIPNLLLQGDLSQRTTGMIVNALEEVGHKEAQAALATIMLDNDSKNEHVVRQAIGAVSGIKKPEPELVETLWQVAQQSEEESSTALLALGAASHNLANSGDDFEASQIRQRLVDSLQAETADSWKQHVALSALKNTDNTELFPTVAPYLEAEDEQVRATAHSVLENFDDVESFEKLITSVTQDESVMVRQSALNAVSHREDKDQAIEPIRQYLSEEADQDVRRDMIRFLGDNKTDNPEVITTLKQQVTQETSEEMIKEVYKALYKKSETE